MTVEFEIRGGRPGNEAAIEAVVTSAFGSENETDIVSLMRSCHPPFDPRFSARK